MVTYVLWALVIVQALWALFSFAAICDDWCFNPDRVWAWVVSLVITVISLVICIPTLIHSTIIDNQQGAICRDNGGEWALGKCYRGAQEIQL